MTISTSGGDRIKLNVFSPLGRIVITRSRIIVVIDDSLRMFFESFKRGRIVTKRHITHTVGIPSDSLGIGTRSSTLDFNYCCPIQLLELCQMLVQHIESNGLLGCKTGVIGIGIVFHHHRRNGNLPISSLAACSSAIRFSSSFFCIA
ncbi:hypothetical protein Tco_1104321 [Tanacetum coccineum]